MDGMVNGVGLFVVEFAETIVESACCELFVACACVGSKSKVAAKA